jgi:uncharacterized protein
VQRTNTLPRRGTRSFVQFSIIAFVALWALVLPFILSGSEPPAWLLLVGRWLPALASLVVVLWLTPLRVPLVDLWGLRIRSWRRTLAWAGIGLAAVVVAQLVQVGVGVAAGLATWAPTDGWLLALATSVVPLALVTTLSTLGEEVAWRGHLAKALSHLGFWRSTLLIGLVWMLWHLPLVAAYAAADVLPMATNLVTNLGIALFAPLLAAVAIRGGSVWPAAIAHAVPPFTGVMVTDASPWFHVVFLVAMLGLGILLAPKGETAP